jgi:hypothetical protein
MYYMGRMKTTTVSVRVPNTLISEIEVESERRGISKSAIIRERLKQSPAATKIRPSIADLVGSVKGLPRDLSANVDKYLHATGYGRNRRR